MGPGDQAFVRWAKQYISVYDADLVRIAYKKAKIILVDNDKGTFRFIDIYAAFPTSLRAAAENVHVSKSRRSGKPKWNQLTDAEREKLSKTTTSELWEKQERVELAIAKLDARRK